MKAYLRCPACKQTSTFRVDVLMTGTWYADAGFIADLGSPQVRPEYYIACMDATCEADGFIQDFWVSGPEWMTDGYSDQLFLDELHEMHKDQRIEIEKLFTSKGWHIEDRDHFCYAYTYDLPGGRTVYVGKDLGSMGGSECPTLFSDPVYEELVDSTGCVMDTWEFDSLDEYLNAPNVKVPEKEEAP